MNKKRKICKEIITVPDRLEFRHWLSNIPSRHWFMRTSPGTITMHLRPEEAVIFKLRFGDV